MKKTSKTTKTPAPAKKAKPAARKAPVVPAVKKTAPKPAVTTTLSAHLDVGFGNALYVRGEGPGLSWEKGLLMECVADDRWTLVLAESARPVVFKFLLNDEIWSTGEDYTAPSGTSAVFTPVF
jgi:hypothetical protein